MKDRKELEMKKDDNYKEELEIDQLSFFDDEDDDLDLFDDELELQGVSRKLGVFSPGVIGILKNIGGWIFTIFLAFALAIIINTYIIRASEVHGRSMLPSLKQGDVVFISRLPYIFSEPKRGDIVVFDSTKKKRNFLVEVDESLRYNLISQKLFKFEGTNDYYIKRVIAVPGDLIEVKEGVLYLNGEEFIEDYINKEPISDNYRYDFSLTVKEGHVFCMGDNRSESNDSRNPSIGQVPYNSVLGKVVIGG